MKLCKCGRIVKDRCEYCNPKENHKQTTKERGYDYSWDKLSKLKRTHNPLCEVCCEKGMVTPATEVHHKVKIKNRPDLRLDWDNLMSVCRSCHEAIERAN
jgi:5-methylcytosine-specific restriction protein A